MRLKLMLHYAGTFLVICLLIVLVNVFYMKSQVYTESKLYHYVPDELLNEVAEGVQMLSGETIELDANLKEALLKQGIGLEIVNEDLERVYDFNRHTEPFNRYRTQDLLDLNFSEAFTFFSRTIEKNGREYSIFIFMDKALVQRTVYTYDVNRVAQAYNIYWLVGMNAMLLLMFAYVYSQTISGPIYRMIHRISALYQEDYQLVSADKGLFSEAEQTLNQLAIRLAEQEKLREEWISNLTHDIRTPLTTIMGHAELLGDLSYDTSNEERYKKCVSIINKTRYIDQLIQELNFSTRLNSGAIKLNKKRVNVCALTRSYLIEIIEDHDEYPLNVSFVSNEACLWLELDESLYKRIVFNIVSNAIVHNTKDVEIQVKIEKKDTDYVDIMIEDDGRGVDENELNHLFNRYFRGTSTLANTAGTGLGMAIAYESVLAHSGTIQARNVNSNGLTGGLSISIRFNQIKE